MLFNKFLLKTFIVGVRWWICWLAWLWWIFYDVCRYQGYKVVRLKYTQFLIVHYISLKLRKKPLHWISTWIFGVFQILLKFSKLFYKFSNSLVKKSSGSNCLYCFQYILKTVYSITWHKQREQYSNLWHILGTILLL